MFEILYLNINVINEFCLLLVLSSDDVENHALVIPIIIPSDV